MKIELLRAEQARTLARTWGQSCFHDPQWNDAVAEQYQRPIETVAVRVALGDGHSAALFGGMYRQRGLRCLESAPLDTYGGWCSPQGELSGADQLRLYRALLQHPPAPIMRLVGPVGMHHALPRAQCPSWYPAALSNKLQVKTLSTHVLPIQHDDQTLLAGMKQRFRYHIRRQHHTRIERHGNKQAHVDGFVALYEAGSKQWKVAPSPLLNLRFLAQLAHSDMAQLWSAYLDGSQVASALFLLGKREVFYFASGILRVSQTPAPLDLLLWDAIRHYRDQGFQTFNFGASAGLDSVRQFKEKFGAREQAYERGVYVFAPWLTPLA